MATNGEPRDLLGQTGDSRLSRRAFLARAAAIGFSASSIAGLLAACGGAASTSTPAPTTTPASGSATSAPTTAPAGGGTTSTATPAGAAPAASQSAATPASAATTALATKPPAAALAKDQVFKFAFGVKLTAFDPAQEGGYGRWIIPQVFMPPFQFSGAGKPDTLAQELLPGTCLKYDVSADGLTYTLHVDPAAKWTDGSKVTASDLKGWMEYVSSPDNPGPYKTVLSNVKGHPAVNKGDAKEMEGLVAVDEGTLQIVLLKADPLFAAAALIHYNLGGTKAAVARADPNGWWLKNPPSNGPFKIEKLDFDTQEFNFVPNPQWWRDPKPTLTHIQGLGVADPQTVRVMFDSHQVDAIFVFGSDAIQMETKYPASVVPMVGTESNGMFFWAFNAGVEPTTDIMVRKALRHAVDVPTLVQAVYQGKRKAGKGPIQEGVFGSRYDTIDKTNDFFKFDPNLAKQELAQSKYGSVDNLPSLAITPSAPSGDKVRATEIMVEMWRKNLGITKIESRPTTTDYGDDWPKKVSVIRISSGGLPDAADLMKSFGYSTSALASRYMGGYKNADLDALIDQAYYMDRKDPAYITTVQKAEDLYLADYTYVPLLVDPYSYYVQPWVKNLKANRHNIMFTLPEVYITPH
jgi:peptide/nickel transport system substrate-binding protein